MEVIPISLIVAIVFIQCSLELTVIFRGECLLAGFKMCDNGRCIRDTWICDGEDDCGDGSDETKSACNQKSTCLPNQMSCLKSGKCIPLEWKCDGEGDCDDRSDEDNHDCLLKVCTPDQFACSNRVCIPKRWVCDGAADCSNGKDEEDCAIKCPANRHTCPNGLCIDKFFLCDGDNDCGDHSDERNCSECTSHQFQCADKTCTQLSYQCDGDYDCMDRSDELNCDYLSTPSNPFCKNGEFQCHDLITCIDSSRVCNGINDCPDGEDEMESTCKNVTCGLDEFKCKDNKCIPGILQCNGINDCSDKSDEDDCDSPKNDTCSNDEFDCSKGVCIASSKVCDGHYDCPNGEDEPGGKCGVNECMVNNGGCSQLCVDTPISFQCKCRQGFRLVGNATCDDIDECEDPSSCSQICINEKGTFKCECNEGYTKEVNNHRRCKASDSDAALVFTKRLDIRELSLHHSTSRVLINETKWAVALDLDIRDGIIFWSDAYGKMIYRANITGNRSPIPTIRQDITLCDGLAVDWIYKHFYWTDAGTDTISFSDFEGSFIKVVIKDQLEKPRAIALNPIDGWMYWSDWGTESRIERAGMDGSHRSTIVSEDVEWPNGITLDFVKKRLYWIDARLDIISSCNYDGTKRKTILKSSESLKHPFSLAVFEDYMYWTDWSHQAIFQADKFDGSKVKKIYGSYPGLMVVHVNHPFKQPLGINHCKSSNCSHICLPTPQINPHSPKMRCVCPDGLYLMDDRLRCSKDKVTPQLHTTTIRTITTLTTLTEAITKKLTHRPSTTTSHDGTTRRKSSETTKSKLSVTTARITAMTKDLKGINDAQPIVSDGNTSKSAVFITVFSVLAFLGLVSALLYYFHRRYYVESGGTTAFVNPLYRRTNDDTVSLTRNDSNEQHLHNIEPGNVNRSNNYENFL